MEARESETWKPIPGIDGYEASSEGRIRSVDRYIERSDGRVHKLRGVVLKPAGNKRDEYLRVQVGRKHTMKTVHRLVCLAFHGPPPGEDSCVRHLNDNKRDNRQENLRWGSYSDNSADSLRNGTWNNQNSIRDVCTKGHPFDVERKDGRRGCSKCRNEYLRQYRKENADRLREYQRVKAAEYRKKKKEKTANESTGQ